MHQTYLCSKASQASSPAIKELLLFFFLFIFVLLINLPVLSLDLMYPEQALIYTANQSLHSIQDLFQIYLHPKMFHISILFFRPSGHFLMYQILAPLLGWHNTKGFIFINLLFLALTAYVLLKLYALLFPQFKIGGYLALSVYLMHPALILSRLIILHFEFAYTFFTLLSLYFFILFCRTIWKNYYLLAVSLCLYILAVTFKEVALALGPILFSYFCFSRYNNPGLSLQKTRQILLLIFMLTLSLIFYLSLQWPTLQHPLHKNTNLTLIITTLHKLWLTLWGPQGPLFPPPVWRNVIFPKLTVVILWTLGFMALLGTFLLFITKPLFLKNQEQHLSAYKRSLLFLYLATILVSILPLIWGWGLPWHLNLTLLFGSLIFGFSAEYLGYTLFNDKIVLIVLFLAALGIGLSTIVVNQANIRYILVEQAYPLNVGRNAVLHPPKLNSKLKDNSIILLEDSRIQDAYLLGASIYPFYASFKLNSPNLDADESQYEQTKKSLFLKQEPIYNGTLFKWAYLRPKLREEIYPFKVDQLEPLPDLILYHWLQHYDQIFCLGYDEEAQWHDRSAVFKNNLLLEKKRRGLVVNHYKLLPATALKGKVISLLSLPFPEPQLCQLTCDQNKDCKGFTYLNLEKGSKSLTQCLLYSLILKQDIKSCSFCSGFIKLKPFIAHN